MIITIGCITIIGIIIMAALSWFFSDESCLPYKRKLENKLHVIARHVKRHGPIEIDYKGKHFTVAVSYNDSSYHYHYYTVYINGNIVKTFHILKHLFSKSRLEEHHGNMFSHEEDEIIDVAYECVKKTNKEIFDKMWSERSYFN